MSNNNTYESYKKHDGANQFKMRSLYISGAILVAVTIAISSTGFAWQPSLQNKNNLQANAKSEVVIPADHPLFGAVKLAKMSRDALSSIADYEATLTKRELIKGKLITQQMEMRLKQNPFSVYLKYKNPHVGREVLYVQGANNNQMLAHEGTGFASWAGTISLPVNGAEAMKENHYPVTSIGMSNLLEQVITQWESESKYAEINVLYYPEAKIGEVKCVAIEATHPRPRRQFPYSMVRLYLDRKTHLPIRVELYAWPRVAGGKAPLYAEYTYTNIKTNVGMNNFDFDRRNPRYKFN